MLRMENITVQAVRFLYGSTTDGLKMEILNDRTINLAEIEIRLIIIIISLVTHVLFF